MKKRGMCLLLVILILLTQIPFAFAVIESGKLSNDLTWTLDDNGTLTISGTGNMPYLYGYQSSGQTNSDMENFALWHDYRDKVRKVIIESGVKDIGAWVFFNCDSLISVVIPESVTSIGDRTSGGKAFDSCDNLSAVYYQGSQQQWEAVSGREELSNATIRYNSNQADSDNNNNALIVPIKDIHSARCGNNLTWKLDGDTLIIHGAGAMYDFSILDEPPWHYLRDNIVKAIIEDGVTSIGSDAFWNCEKLASVIIPESVTSIGASAFRDCDDLMSIIIPNSVTNIDQGAFYSCSNLTNVTLSDNLVNIEDTVFSHCEKLTNVEIPHGVTSIGDSSFYNSGVTSAIIPDKVTAIGKNAFNHCDNLKTVVIPGSVKTMEWWAFAYCPNLTDVTILNGVTVIGDLAFMDCGNLTNLTLPESITNIERSAFSGCDKLKDVYYGGSPGSDRHQWDAVVGTAALKSANIHYNSSGPNSEPITPTPVEPTPQANNDISKYSYAFGNDAKSFGYHSGYKIPLDSFQLIFGKTALAKQKCEQAFSESQSWEGSCYGMDATVGMIVVSGNGVSAAFRNGATRPGELNASDTHASWNLTLTQFIEAMQISQYSSMSAIASRQNRNRLSALTSAVSAFENGGGGPVLICVYGPDRNGNYAGHALLAYHLDGQRLYVYDCNYPNDGTRAITLSNGGWSYTIADGVTWNNSNGHITYIPYETYLSNWMNRGHVQDMAYVSLVVNVADATVSDSAGNEVAVFQNGKMTRGSETAYPFTRLGITADGVSATSPQVAVWLPVDEVYTVTNQDASKASCKVSLCNVNQGVSVETDAASVTLLAEDASNTNSAMIASAGCNYTVTQMSGEDEVVFQGKTGRDKFISMITNGVSTERSGLTESTSVTMNGKPVALGNLPNGTTAVGILPSGFVDVSPGQYFYEPVMWAVDCGITNGTSETTFSPHNTCTRNHILTFLWRANGSPTALISNPFTDVDTLKDFGKAAVWAYEKGLVSGKQFNGGAPCSRADVVTYLWKLAGRPSAGRNAFQDVPSNADYAQAVSWAVERGVTKGTTDTTFEPSKTCTRGQIVTFLYRAYVES